MKIKLLALATAALMIAGCATPPPPPSGGLADLLERPAERALVEGIRAYDDGNYPAAETALRRALDAGPSGGPNGGLQSGRDRATAYKLLAFITCTSERMAECEDSFRAARQADPAFVLSRAETGHPLWGPVYRKVLPPAS